MTATKYLRKKRQVLGWYSWTPMLTVGPAVLIGFVVYPHFTSWFNHDNFWKVMVAAVAAVPIYFGIWEVISRLEKRFIRRHPEMADVDQWVAIMGSADDYPLTTQYSRALISRVAGKLEVSAKSANAAFVVRDRIRQVAETFDPSTLERALIQPIYDELAKEAESRNQQYLREWRLLMDRMHILPQAITPQTFRVSFLKKS